MYEYMINTLFYINEGEEMRNKSITLVRGEILENKNVITNFKQMLAETIKKDFINKKSVQESKESKKIGLGIKIPYNRASENSTSSLTNFVQIIPFKKGKNFYRMKYI